MSTISLPNLWLPRPRLWRPQWWFAAKHLCKDKTSGHLLKTNGHLMKEPCKSCNSDRTTCTVTFTGVQSRCAGSPQPLRDMLLAGSIDGTYTLTGSGRWVAEGTDGPPYHYFILDLYYQDTDCGSAAPPPFNTQSVARHIALGCYDNTYTLCFRYFFYGVTSGTGRTLVFDNMADPGVVCAGAVTNLGQGGTAVVTFSP
jgi:hypothetical protein